MTLKFRSGHQIYVYSEYIDMRAGYERLSMLVREKMNQDLLRGDLFLFLGSNSKRLKGICFDGTGFLLFSKRLEKASFMRLSQFESLELSHEELEQLLHGSVIRKLKFGDEALTSFHSQVILNASC